MRQTKTATRYIRRNCGGWMYLTRWNAGIFTGGAGISLRTASWDKIRKAIKADFAESVWEHLVGAISAPFAIGENEQVAVKVIDDRGNELLVVKTLKEVG